MHCVAGPLVVAWWGSHLPDSANESLELAFLGLSGLLVAVATGRHISTGLQRTLWMLFAVFAASTLLAERWPVLEMVQSAASVGLIGAHLLNQRHNRCCLVKRPATYSVSK